MEYENYAFPFSIGGRIKPDVLTENIAKNLNLELTVKETASKQKAWDNVKELLDKRKNSWFKIRLLSSGILFTTNTFCWSLCSYLWL